MAIRPRLPRLSGVARFALAPAAAACVLGVLVDGGLKAAATAVGAVAAVAAIVGAARRPAAALGVVIVYVPLQLALLALLYHHGAPAAVVRNLGFLKEVMVAGVVLAAIHRLSRPDVRLRADALDWTALGYVGIATAYLLLPLVFHGAFGGQTFQIRLIAWRTDVLFVVLMLAARRLPFSATALRRLRAAVLAVAAVLVAFAFWEFAAGGSFNRFLINTLGLPAFKADILDVPYADPTNLITHGSLGGVTWARVGSLLNDPLQLGFLLVIPLAFGLERLSTKRLNLAQSLACVMAAVAILMNGTRSAILAGLLAALLSIAVGVRRRSPGRLRVAIALLIGAVALAPIAGATNAQSRFFGVSGAQSSDNQEHLTALQDSVENILRQPQGLGLGANPATGLRFGTSIARTSENAYLQVGIELGAAAMLLFVAMLLLLLGQLRRVWTGRRDPTGLGAGVWLAGWGLALGGMFLHVWLGIATALTFWGLAGAVLGSQCAVDGESVGAVTDPDQRLASQPVVGAIS